MSLLSFRVENQKALRLAECESVPHLMIICGSNGSGKSTLLWELKTRNGSIYDEGSATQILYQGPHRAIRRQTVRRRWLPEATTTFADALAADAVTAPEGLSIPYPNRAPGNIDESGSAIKHVLGSLENRRQAILASIVDKASGRGRKRLDIGSMPNVFGPLDDIVSRLLPHLHFDRIDFEHEDDIHVVFKRTFQGQTTEHDLDDLSSGEKAVILLFLPLVEAEIRDNLKTLESSSGNDESESVDRLFLLDEPELHLHPDLQRRMLAYVRERSSGDKNQFILISHSPTILDEAADEELYVLAPPRGNNNQLQKAASPSERLEALRELTGESYFLSTGRNLICIEGETGTVKGKLSDRSLIELLSRRSSKYTLIPMGGKSQVTSAVRRLRESLPVERYGVSVVGLIDGDRATATAEGCVAWPYCEIENILIRPNLIVKAMEALGSVPPEAPVIEAAISESGNELKDDEVRLGVLEVLGTKIIKPHGATETEIVHNYQKVVDELTALLNSTHISDAVESSRQLVESQISDNSFIQRFRGKKLLRLVYGKLQLGQISYERFCYALAVAGSSDVEVHAELKEIFDALDAEVAGQTSSLLAR